MLLKKFLVFYSVLVYLLILIFIFMDLYFVFENIAVYKFQALPLALGVELLSVFFTSASLVYNRNIILKICAILYTLFLWFLVILASTNMLQNINIISLITTIFVPFTYLMVAIASYIIVDLTKNANENANSIEKTKLITLQNKKRRRKREGDTLVKKENNSAENFFKTNTINFGNS